MFLTKKTLIISIVTLIGLVAILAGVAYLVYPIQADRPIEIREELWNDTIRFYYQVSDEVDRTLAGEDVEVGPTLPEWVDKYGLLALDSVDKDGPMIYEHTKEEGELASAMYQMYWNSLDLRLAYTKNKNGIGSEKEVEEAKKRYEDAKEKVEDILFIWK